MVSHLNKIGSVGVKGVNGGELLDNSHDNSSYPPCTIQWITLILMVLHGASMFLGTTHILFLSIPLLQLCE